MKIINIKNTLPDAKRVLQLSLKTTEIAVSEGTKAIPAIIVGTATEYPLTAAACYVFTKVLGDIAGGALRVLISKKAPKEKSFKIMFGNPLNGFTSTLMLIGNPKNFVKTAKEMFKKPY